MLSSNFCCCIVGARKSLKKQKNQHKMKYIRRVSLSLIQFAYLHFSIFFVLENSFSQWFFPIRNEFMLMTDCKAKKQKIEKKHDHDKKWTVYECNHVGALNKVISNNYILLFFPPCASSTHTQLALVDLLRHVSFTRFILVIVADVDICLRAWFEFWIRNLRFVRNFTTVFMA